MPNKRLTLTLTLTLTYSNHRMCEVHLKRGCMKLVLVITPVLKAAFVSMF